MRVLFAEDDPQFGAAVARGLRERSCVTDLVSDGARALELALAGVYDVLILDVMLPGLSGIEVARELRARGSHLPTLMLTARDAVADRIEGLDAGADDYLVKPFAFDELFARLRALLRRATEILPTVITAGDLAVDTCRQTATRNGRPIPLTSKEYALLEYLAREKGRVVSRADISAHVWDATHDPMSNTIEVYVNRLRAKLSASGASSVIRTRRGSGYALVDPPREQSVT